MGLEFVVQERFQSHFDMQVERRWRKFGVRNECWSADDARPLGNFMGSTRNARTIRSRSSSGRGVAHCMLCAGGVGKQV